MDDLRIVLLGKQGAGKSASGNTLLHNRSFHSAASSEGVTKACSLRSSTVNGQTIKVIDTPGWCDSSQFETDIKQDIINISHPGPHVFLLVLPIGRFTNEEIDTVMSILKEFGDEVTKYMIVLFTKGDDLEGRPIEDYLKEVQSNLKTIIQLCGRRYHVFNNRDKNNVHQVSSLLKKINKMVACNEKKYFTTAMYPKVELCIKKDEQSEDKRRQQITKEADSDSVQNKSLSASENGGQRNRSDAEEGDRNEQESWKKESTQSTKRQGLKQTVIEEGERNLLKVSEEHDHRMSGHSYGVDGRRHVEDDRKEPKDILKENTTLKREIGELRRKLEKREGQLKQIMEERQQDAHHYEKIKQAQKDIIEKLRQEKEEEKQKRMAIQKDFEQMEKMLSEHKTTDEKTKTNLMHAFVSRIRQLF